MPHIPLPLGHSADTNEATMDPSPENAACWHDQYRPREILEEGSRGRDALEGEEPPPPPNSRAPSHGKCQLKWHL